MFTNLKFYKIILIISFFLTPNISLGDDIEKFANKLFHHYEYDDKINKYLVSFFSFGNSNSNSNLKSNKPSHNSVDKLYKQTLKIKNKNKMIYSFGNGQSLQINPSNLDQTLIYNSTPFSYFEFKKDSILYGININF